MPDSANCEFRLGITLSPGATGLCALDVDPTGRAVRLRGVNVRLTQPVEEDDPSPELVVHGLEALLSEIVAEQGCPRDVLISTRRLNGAGTRIDTSMLRDRLGGVAPIRRISDEEVSACLQGWKLMRPDLPEGRHYNPRRTAIEAFATAVTPDDPVRPRARELRQALPGSLDRLVALSADHTNMSAGDTPPRRYLDVTEQTDGRWSTAAGGVRQVMRIHEGDLMMLGTGSESKLARVVRWGSRSNVLWLAPSSEPGDLRRRHHDPNDPLRCRFVPVGRLKSMDARIVAVDCLGAVRDPG